MAKDNSDVKDTDVKGVIRTAKIASYVALAFAIFGIVFFVLTIPLLIVGEWEDVISFPVVGFSSLGLFFGNRSLIKDCEKGELEKAKKKALILGILGILFNIFVSIFDFAVRRKLKKAL